MEMQNALKLITVLSLLDAIRTVTISSPSFSPIVIEAKYEHTYNKTINATVEYVFLYPASNVSPDEINSLSTYLLLTLLLLILQGIYFLAPV